MNKIGYCLGKCGTCGKNFNAVGGLAHCNSCVKWDKRGMELATLVATWSKDPSTQVGAAIFDAKRRIMGVGFNGFARGVKDHEERLNDRKKKYPRIIHAEINAILNSQDGGTVLYCTLFPCAPCSGPIIQYGIKRVVTPPISLDRWSESQQIAKEDFTEAGLTIQEWTTT